MESLPYQIECLPSLRELDLAHNSLTWITEDIGQAKDHLKILDLYNNKLDLVGAEPIKDLDQLQELDLGLNDLSLDEIASLSSNYALLESNLRKRRNLTRTDLPQSISREVAIDEEIEEEEEDVWEKSFKDGWSSNDCANSGENLSNPCQEDIEEELWSTASTPSQSVTTKEVSYAWTRKAAGSPGSGDQESRDETWDGYAGNANKGPVQYDFGNMGQYLRGRNKFCPSDLHPASVARGEIATKETLSYPMNR